ncbi:MAG: YrzE family protein [Alphaproteobacteria bacterium]|nr:YrzE family protein [Alphaproteobacteria bacterium]
MAYILFSAFITVLFAGFAISRKNKKLVLIASVIYFVIMGLINYFGLPTLAFWGFHAVWVEITISILLGTVLSYVDSDLYFDSDNTTSYRWIGMGFVIFLFIVSQFQSCGMGNSDKYNALLGEVEVAQDSLFNREVHPISVEKMRSVDEDYAKKIAEDKLGLDPGLGSRARIGKMSIQSITGEFVINDGEKLVFNEDLIWVAPLEHTGFWRWFNNHHTDGYVIVDATDYQKVYLVTKINGQKLKMKYIESACFDTDIERHIRNNGYLSRGVHDHCLEIDSNGRPYWVLASYEKTIGFGGSDSKGVITVDAQSGELNEYSIEEAPEWIDRIQPEDFMLDQISYWGAYKEGWWNSFFAKQGVELPTSDYNESDGSTKKGMSIVYSEGRSYWYTGIKSANADDGTSGFMLIDTKSKKAKLYRIAGFNESQAKKIANDQPEASAAGYVANEPILYNVKGVPTYFVTLKGSSGNVTAYCFIAVNNRQAVGYGSSKKEAEKKYIQRLLATSQDKILDGPVKELQIELIVKDITHENDVYYVLFESEKGKEFYGSSQFFKELRWTKKGDKVQVSFGEGNDNLISLNSFENVSFNY